MEQLTRDVILNADDLPKETVAVPEWGGDVIVRTMPADDRDAYELACFHSREANEKAGRGDDQNHIRARLTAWTAVDEQGERIFSDDDVAALGQKSAAAVQRIFAVAQRLNGLGPGDVEELEKNSQSSPGDDSASA